MPFSCFIELFKQFYTITHLDVSLYSPQHEKTWLCKGTDQPVLPHSLISVFFLLIGKYTLSSFLENFNILASRGSYAGWAKPYLIANPEDRVAWLEVHIARGSQARIFKEWKYHCCLWEKILPRAVIYWILIIYSFYLWGMFFKC